MNPLSPEGQRYLGTALFNFGLVSLMAFGLRGDTPSFQWALAVLVSWIGSVFLWGKGKKIFWKDSAGSLKTWAALFFLGIFMFWAIKGNGSLWVSLVWSAVGVLVFYTFLIITNQSHEN